MEDLGLYSLYPLEILVKGVEYVALPFVFLKVRLYSHPSLILLCPYEFLKEWCRPPHTVTVFRGFVFLWFFFLWPSGKGAALGGQMGRVAVEPRMTCWRRQKEQGDREKRRKKRGFGGGASLRGSEESKSREEKTEDLRYIRSVFFAHFY